MLYILPLSSVSALTSNKKITKITKRECVSVAPLANLSCPLEDLSSSWTPQMSACQSHIISTPQTARINEITAVFNLGLLFKINCWICTPVRLLFSEQYPNYPLPQPCWWNNAPHSAVKWWSAESIKEAQNVIFFIGLSGLLATPHSYSRSMNQQAVCSPHSLCVLLSFLCMDKDESGAEETRYGHYRRRRLTIVASLQATVSAHSEDQGSSSLSHWPQPVACSKRT